MTRYQYDYYKKNVLIRYIDNNIYPEILHKGDSTWVKLEPRPDYKDEEYCRAIFLGQGVWANLVDITEEEALQIFNSWTRNTES